MSDLIERLRLDDRAIFAVREAADALESQAKRIAELEAHANELAATCHERDETIHKHWCRATELEAEVAALRTDAGRLDYIERNARRDPKMDGNHVWWPTTFRQSLRGPNLRAAIDAAKEQQ